MGALDALDLPDYLERWGVRYELCPHWDTVARSSGGWDAMLGIIIHHDAIPATVADTWAASMPPRVGGRRADGPVGNGSLEHDGRFRFWCARASNTSGMGGPILGSRGVIGKDNANRTTFNIEARNDGIGEPWTPAQVEAWPLLCAAVIDWANHETPGAELGAGDVWAHAIVGPGWTNRKVDPRGPSPWAPAGVVTWDMHRFRADVFARLYAGPDPVTPPDPEPTPDPLYHQENQPMMLAKGSDGSLLLVFANGYAKNITPEQWHGLWAANATADGGNKLIDGQPLNGRFVDELPRL